MHEAVTRQLGPAPTNVSAIFNVASIAQLATIKTALLQSGSVAHVDGYASANDGGQGDFYFDALSSVAADGGIVIAPATGGGRWKRILAGTVVNVRWFGAKGDGATDDSAAISAALASVRTAVANNPVGGDRVSGFTAYFPAGTYVVGTSETLLPSGFATKAQGYRIVGDGPGQTQIWFKPVAGSRVLFSNASAFLTSQVRDITFVSDSNLNTFMLSVSNNPPGAVQRWTFERVQWSGSWGKGFNFQGNNNNSEFRFVDCGVDGEMTTYLYVAAAGTSDQFLNFWFENMKFWPTAAAPATNCFCEFNKGGHIKIHNSDFSGLQSGTLFKLKGTSHGEGVCYFVCSGTRFELKSDNVKVLESEWPQGLVAFNDCDFSSQAPAYSSSTIAFEITDFNFLGAMVRFVGCSLIGMVKLTHGTDDFRQKKVLRFENCEHRQFRDFTDCFMFVSSTNNGGHRAIQIEGCRGSGTGLNFYTAWVAATAYNLGDQRKNGLSLYEVTVAGVSAGAGGPTGKGSAIVDGTVTWKWIANDTRDYATGDCVLQYLPGTTYGVENPPGLRRRVVSFKNANQGLPATGNKLEIILPPGAVLVAARIYAKAGAVGSGATATYAIKSAEAAPTTFASGNHTPASDGFDYTWTGIFMVGTDIAKRTLILESDPAVDQVNAGGIAYVEFIA